MFTCVTESPEETSQLAEKVGQKVREGTVLCLEGDLGAGKTLFAKTLAKTLGVEGEVTSPTFNLMNVYKGICPIWHFDLYRLDSEEELEDIGFFEYTDEPEGIVLVEWPDKFPSCLPDDYIEIKFTLGSSKNQRRISFTCVGEENQEFLKELEDFVNPGNRDGDSGLVGGDSD